MAANYDRPKPIDPVFYRRGCIFRIRCGCGHSLAQPLGLFADERDIPRTSRIHEIIARLRCSRCGAKPTAEVTKY